jgi:hypothetical protein
MNPSLSLPASTDDVIEAIIRATVAHAPSPQAEHLYRESLRNLVRLAKAEHACEVRMQSNCAEPVYPEHIVH